LGCDVSCYSTGFSMPRIQHHGLDFCYCQQQLYTISQISVWDIKSDCWNGRLEQVTDWINTGHEKLRNSFLLPSFKFEAFRACLECDSWLHHFLSDVPKFILPGVSYNFALGGLLSYILSTTFSIRTIYRLSYTKFSFLGCIGHLTPWSMKKKRLWITTTTVIIIIIINKKTKNTFLIHIAVPNTHNLAKTITYKQNKYQELANEICAMWKQNTAQVIPLIVSSMGVIPKSLPQSLKRLNLHPNGTYKCKKSVILGTCSIVRNFLNYKYDHRPYSCWLHISG
jgi:hypothetical protein